MFCVHRSAEPLHLPEPEPEPEVVCPALLFDNAASACPEAVVGTQCELACLDGFLPDSTGAFITTVYCLVCTIAPGSVSPHVSQRVTHCMGSRTRHIVMSYPNHAWIYFRSYFDWSASQSMVNLTELPCRGHAALFPRYIYCVYREVGSCGSRMHSRPFAAPWRRLQRIYLPGATHACTLQFRM